MPRHRRSPSKRNPAITLAVSLVATFLVLLSPNLSETQAAYTAFDTTAITYNDQVCNLGDPAAHLNLAAAFEISTSNQLWEVTDCVSTSAVVYFKLASDIDLSLPSSAPTSSPIGYLDSATVYSFSGVLDGQNRKIHNINMSTESYGVGLFALLNNATFSNLVLAGNLETTILNSRSSDHSAGALAIRSEGSLFLSSISNEANVSGNEGVGGLIGRASSTITITNSQNFGEIIGRDNAVGGLVGYIWPGNANITDSCNRGAVSSAGYYTGGLVGYVRAGTANISRSCNVGPISSSGNSGGGLVGYVSSNATIRSSYNIAPISASNEVGGLVGSIAGVASAENSFNSGSISGSGGSVGGLFGYAFGSVRVSSSYNVGTVSANGTYAGGFAGVANQNGSTISLSYNVGAVSGASQVDGIFGIAGTVRTTSALSSVATRYLSTTPSESMRASSSYLGFNFVSTWGYGGCNNNDGYPILLIFANVPCYSQPVAKPRPTTQSSVVPVTQSQSSTPPTGESGSGYEGPMFDAVVSARAGEFVTLTGYKLDYLTSAFLGDAQITISSATSQSIVLMLPPSVSAGVHDLVFFSSYGKLTYQNGLVVMPAIVIATQSEAAKIYAVGSFNGSVVIYTKGHLGAKLSAKIAGKWLVVPALNESWKGRDYSRSLRKARPGKSIKVHLFVDGKYLSTHSLTTR